MSETQAKARKTRTKEAIIIQSQVARSDGKTHYDDRAGEHASTAKAAAALRSAPEGVCRIIGIKRGPLTVKHEQVTKVVIE